MLYMLLGSQNVYLNEIFDQSTQNDIATDVSISQPYCLESEGDENTNIFSLIFRRGRFLALFICGPKRLQNKIVETK